MEQRRIECCQHAQQADRKGQAGNGQKAPPAIAQSVLENQWKESHGRFYILRVEKWGVVLNCSDIDRAWMRRALELAAAASAAGEAPVGAVIVDINGQFLAEAYNRPIAGCDPTAHAEILALRAAAAAMSNYRLTGATMYVTLEPCVMCAGALVHARLGRLVFGARDLRFGGVRSKFRLADSDILNHRVEIEEGLMAAEATTLLEDFFRARR